jgi:CHASE3 domain sensor protein
MFTNMKLGVRLGLGFAVVLVLTMIMATVSYVRLAALNTEIENMVTDKFPKTVMANDAVDQINITARAIRNAMLVKSPEEAQKEIDRLMDARKKTGEIFDKLDRQITSDEGRKVFERAMELRKVAVADQETTASIEQMTASIAQNTENAKVTDGMASKAAKEAAEGGEAVNETVEAMKSDRRQDRHHRRHRLPDQPAGAERRDRSGACRRTRQGLCRGGRRSAQAGRTQPGRGAGNRRSGRQQRGDGRTGRQAARRDGAQHPKTSDLVQEIAAASQEQSAAWARSTAPWASSTRPRSRTPAPPKNWPPRPKRWAARPSSCRCSPSSEGAHHECIGQEPRQATRLPQVAAQAAVRKSST